MKTKLFVRSRIVHIGLMVLLGISFAFIPSGGNLVKAESIPQEIRTTMDEPPVTVENQPLNDEGVIFQQRKPKERLERLINLINSSGMTDAVGDMSNLKKMDSHLLDLLFADLSRMDVIQAAQDSDVKITDDRTVLIGSYARSGMRAL
jgi:hypothetical protein